MTARSHAMAPVDVPGQHPAPARPDASASATAAVWCTVRVRGPQGAVDVALPTAGSVAEAVEELAGRLLPGAPLGRPGDTWYLHRLGRPPFPPQDRVGDAGLHDGESLHLSPYPMPRPAQPVDDGLVALAEGAAQVGRWSPRAVQVLAVVGTVVAAAGAAALGLAVPAGPAVPLVLAVGLLGLMVGLRSREDDLPALAAGLASLPAWALGGLGILAVTGGSPSTALSAAAAGVAVGSALAAAVLPRRTPWWAFAGAGAATLAVAAAVADSGLLTPARIAAVVSTLWLAGLLVVPWFAIRRQAWLAPNTLDEDVLVARASATRRTINAISLAGALAVGVCGLVLAGTGQGLALGFVGAVSAAIILRARRTVFILESAGELAAGAVGLTVVVVALVADGGLVLRIGLLVAGLVVLGLLIALGLAAQRAAGGSDTALGWWSRPRTRRTLTILEGVAVVAVLPLLLGVLGVYSAAANAGAGI